MKWMPSTTTPSRERSKPVRKVWRIARDRLIEALGELHCGTPKEIARYILLKEPTQVQIRGVRAMIDRIEDYASSVNATILTSSRFYWGSRTSLIGLTRYGATIARERVGIPTARAFETKDHEHEFILSALHVRLREFAYQKGWGFEWIRNPIDHKKKINPDAVAVFKTPEGKFTFPIEVERQSFTNEHLHKGEKYRDVYGKPECKELFGSEKIRVIFVTMTERRMMTMLQKFSDKYPHKMFWFATMDDVLENIQGSIFHTPKDYKEHTYSFLER